MQKYNSPALWKSIWRIWCQGKCAVQLHWEISWLDNFVPFFDCAFSFVIDIIASTIFGLDVDSFSQPDNDLRRISEAVIQNTPKNILRGTTSFLYPGYG